MFFKVVSQLLGPVLGSSVPQAGRDLRIPWVQQSESSTSIHCYQLDLVHAQRCHRTSYPTSGCRV